MNRISIWLLTALLLAMSGARPANAEVQGVMASGQAVSFDVAPAVVNGLLFVPVRAVAESLGGTVEWDEKTRTAAIKTETATIRLTYGSPVAVVNDTKVSLDAPVTIQDSRLMVPAGFLLTFYGNKLTIAMPDLKDRAAMDLVAKSQQAELTNFDMQLVQQVIMKVVGSKAMEVTLTTTSKAEFRSDDALISNALKMVSPMGDQDNKTTIARRDGQTFINSGDGWHLAPPKQAASAVASADPRNGLKRLDKLIKEAHLGTARTAGGQQLQEVIHTFDVAAVQSLISYMLLSTGAPVEPAASSMVWHKATSSQVIDVNSGIPVESTMDAEVSWDLKDQNETVTVTMRQNMTIKLNNAPIAWSADLP